MKQRLFQKYLKVNSEAKFSNEEKVQKIKIGIQYPFCGEPKRLPYYTNFISNDNISDNTGNNNTGNDNTGDDNNQSSIDNLSTVYCKINGDKYYLKEKNVLEHEFNDNDYTSFTIQIVDSKNTNNNTNNDNTSDNTGNDNISGNSDNNTGNNNTEEYYALVDILVFYE